MQFQSFDFEEYLEETLSNSAKIFQDKLEAEKAMAAEIFFKEAYDNLLNMECCPSNINGEDIEEQRKATEFFFKEAYDNLLNMECSPSDINGEDTEELRKGTDKFLEESYNNLLHMFDGVLETGKV